MKPEDRRETPVPETAGQGKPLGACLILVVLLCPAVLLVAVLVFGQFGNIEAGLLTYLISCPIAGILAARIYAITSRHIRKEGRAGALVIMGIFFTLAAAALSFGGCVALLRFVSI